MNLIDPNTQCQRCGGDLSVCNGRHMNFSELLAQSQAWEDLRKRIRDAEFPYPNAINRHERRKAAAMARRAAR